MSSFFEIWASLPDAFRIQLWNAWQDFQKNSFWQSLDDLHKEGLWNLLDDPHKKGLWNLLDDLHKEGLWNLLDDPHKKGLWNLLDDLHKEGLWKLLDDTCKEGLWKLLEIDRKADLLEILSRAYSLAHVVFSTRKIIEDRLRQEKQFKEYGFKNVYVYLDESDGTMPNGKKAFVYSRVESFGERKSLHLRIGYDTTGGTVRYDANGYIEKQCVRFLIGHEAGHIILDLEDIIKNAINEELREMTDSQERKATLFANIISDLRDLHILSQYGNSGDESSLPTKEIVINDHITKIKNTEMHAEKIKKAVSDLNEESKHFTMSNSIFATKKVMSIVYREDNNNRRISLVFPCKTRKEVAHIGCFKPQEKNKESFGYCIELPEANKNVETDSRDIANAIGALLLNYDVIKSKESKESQIPIIKENFPMENLKNFSDCLRNARKIHLGSFSKNIKSKQRILDMANTSP